MTLKYEIIEQLDQFKYLDIIMTKQANGMLLASLRKNLNQRLTLRLPNMESHNNILDISTNLHQQLCKKNT